MKKIRLHSAFTYNLATIGVFIGLFIFSGVGTFAILAGILAVLLPACSMLS